MITRDMLCVAGRFNKPHGIKGEISVTLSPEAEDADLASVKCIFVEMEGIMVPFFISSLRPKTAGTSLVTMEGIDSEEKLRPFVNRDFCLLRSDLPEPEGLDPYAEGFYASDFIGFEAEDTRLGHLGTITDVNDVTDNVLFVITRPGGGEILVPVADELIDGIDIEGRRLLTSLPEGIVDLN